MLPAIAIVMAACAPSHALGPKVLLVGDSLFNGARAEITAELGRAGWMPTIEADGGTSIVYWSDRVPIVQAFAKADIVVIELGTNDCAPTDCPPLAPYIDQIMNGIASSIPVLWLNVQEDVPNPFSQNRVVVNAALRSADERWPNLYLIDLNGFSAGHPEWHTPDGLHFNDIGRQEFARFVAGALEKFKPE